MGDNNIGWCDVAYQLHTQMPHIKFFLPHAPIRNVTICKDLPEEQMPRYGYTLPAWYDMISLENKAGQPCDGIEESRDTIIRLIDDVVNTYGIPPDRIVVGG